MYPERYERPAVLMSYSSEELAGDAASCQIYTPSDAALKDAVSVISRPVDSLSSIETER